MLFVGLFFRGLSAAATFGAKCGAIVSCGDDDFGKLSLKDLTNRGIDISKSIIKPGEETFFTLAALDDSGEKAMVLCITDVTMPKLEDIDMDYACSGKFLHMIGTYPHLVIPIGQEAKKRGVKVSLDFEPESQNMTQQEKDDTLALSYIVFPNEDGLTCYVGHDDVEKGAREMLAKGPEIVVVTKGAKGCEVFTNEEHFSVPAFKVDVVDTTGAGDTFNAVFVACLSKGYRLQKCAWLATAAAAMQIQKPGSRDGLATEEEAIAFLGAAGAQSPAGEVPHGGPVHPALRRGCGGAAVSG